jgi:hypothetical protein
MLNYVFHQTDDVVQCETRWAILSLAGCSRQHDLARMQCMLVGCLIPDLQLAILWAIMNGLNIMVSDIALAHLMAYAKDIIFFKAKPEFLERNDCLEVTVQSLVKQNSWRDFDTLVDKGFS